MACPAWPMGGALRRDPCDSARETHATSLLAESAETEFNGEGAPATAPTSSPMPSPCRCSTRRDGNDPRKSHRSEPRTSTCSDMRKCCSASLVKRPSRPNCPSSRDSWSLACRVASAGDAASAPAAEGRAPPQSSERAATARPYTSRANAPARTSAKQPWPCKSSTPMAAWRKFGPSRRQPREHARVCSTQGGDEANRPAISTASKAVAHATTSSSTPPARASPKNLSTRRPPIPRSRASVAAVNIKALG
mmetsp:Transcript_36883/g.101494  ORF Transcript_36883/g.101494 Transcript_36883/m.101494 type:complete len:250 (+) Transcript_36883:151-900(+)